MNDVVIASSPADATAVEMVETHHAQLAGALAARVSALEAAVRVGAEYDDALADLVAWTTGELLPHARAEEKALYPAGQAMPAARMLVEAMLAEHQVIADLVAGLEAPGDGLRAVGTARALEVLFEVHMDKENEQLLPALAEDADVSLAQLVGAMHDLLGAEKATVGQPGHASQPTEAASHGGHQCACHESEAAGDPELDARVVPHAIRHATIFGALDAVRPGGGLVLIAPHDPLPLLAQVEQRYPDAFEVSYLERGPEAWRLRFLRR